MAKKIDTQGVISTWLERDLTAAAHAGELAPAFEVEASIERMCDVMASGRHPIVSGEPGVGKTALVYELVRRAVQGAESPLEGKRVLQFSLRNRVSALAKPEQMKPEMQKLVEALLATREPIVPFFRDMHLAYTMDLEPQLELLAMRHRAPILGEGEGTTLDSMIEGTPDLGKHYVTLQIDEPSLGEMRKILVAWAKHRAGEGQRYKERALDHALELCHRFLARSRLPRKAVDFLDQVASVVGRAREVGEADVIERFHKAYRVPRFLIDPAIPFDPEATEQTFRSKVLGQPESVRAVVRMIGLIKAGLSDTRRPFGAFLFVGPTGVGKTHIAQLLAEHLFGSRDRVIRINMADFQNAADAYTLFGNPDAYGRQRRGHLTMRVMGHPFGVMLLDEFEKAHEKVHDRFLQLIDEGAFINGAAETVSCRSMIIIATSNAGAEVYRGRSLGFAQAAEVAALDGELDRMLFKHFRHEFLNRFDQIVHFHPLGRDEIRTIALREVEALRERPGIRTRGIQLSVDEGMLDWLTAHGYDPHYGARFLKRLIERNVTTSLAELIFREPLRDGARVELSVRAGRVVAKLVDEAVPQATSEQVRLPEGSSERMRALDKKGLVSEAESLMQRAAPFLVELEARRDEATALLSRMNEPGFWDDALAAQEVVDRFRTLDVALQLGARLAEPVRALAELRDALQRRAGGATLSALARGIERAAASVTRWEEQSHEEGSARFWLLLRNVDSLNPADNWLAELTEMELAWCRRLRLGAEIVACGWTDDKLARTVLEVEGPGAAACLGMEKGVHRLHRAGKASLRVRIDLVSRVAAAPRTPRRTTLIERRAGPLGLEARFKGRAAHQETGQMLDFCAKSRDLLELLVQDVEQYLASAPPNEDVVRTYAQAGAGARDARTGVVIPRFKDVLKGKLDPFLEAWRQCGYGQRLA